MSSSGNKSCWLRLPRIIRQKANNGSRRVTKHLLPTIVLQWAAYIWKQWMSHLEMTLRLYKTTATNGAQSLPINRSAGGIGACFYITLGVFSIIGHSTISRSRTNRRYNSSSKVSRERGRLGERGERGADGDDKRDQERWRRVRKMKEQSEDVTEERQGEEIWCGRLRMKEKVESESISWEEGLLYG